MSVSIAFRYEGNVPSKSNYRKGGKNWREQWKRIKKFESEVGWLAKAAGAKCSDKPAELYVIAINQGLDLDNILKGTVDSLKHVAFYDDSQKYLIGVHIAAAKSKDSPGLGITIRYSEESSCSGS
jgi:Holliday junction resolvase RusA-like endonuclease